MSAQAEASQMRDVAAGNDLDAPLLDPVDEAESYSALGDADDDADAADDNDDDDKPTSFGKELCMLIKTFIPIFLMMSSWVAMNVTDSALLGHVGTMYLDAQALQSLWTSSTGVFLTARVLVTFCAQSFGAGNKELVGIWAQVGLTTLSLVCIVVCAAWALTGPILSFAQGLSNTTTNATGNNSSSEPDLVWPAWYYALVLMGALPARVVAGIFNQFLQAQMILMPSVFASVAAVVLNVLLGLVFVLGIPFNPNPNFDPNDQAPNSTITGGFGYPACPIVTAAMEWVQAFIVVVVFMMCCKTGRECWPSNGFTCSNVFSRNAKGERRMVLFIKMWLPAALVRLILFDACHSILLRSSIHALFFFSLSRVLIYDAGLSFGLLAGCRDWDCRGTWLSCITWCHNTSVMQFMLPYATVLQTGLGEDELGAFNTSYRILWMCMTFSGSVSYAISLKLSKVRVLLVALFVPLFFGWLVTCGGDCATTGTRKESTGRGQKINHLWACSAPRHCRSAWCSRRSATSATGTDFL